MPHSKGWERRRDERASRETALGDVVADLMREPLFARGVAVGRLAAEWEAIVGRRLAAQTAPRAVEGGTLIVAATTGPWGAQARFLGDEIRVQANRALGAELVRDVRVLVHPEPRKAL
jgi:predicted nucleic acid-binding Zn ribbon protein